MSVAEVVAELGGTTTRQALVRATDRNSVRRALAEGVIVAVARGRYALPQVEEAVVVAHALGGVLSHESAALQHGWPVKEVPDRPHVTVPRRRRVPHHLRALAHLHYVDLSPEDVNGHVTSHERTLVDCLRSCSFDAALAVADSAARESDAGLLLARIARTVRGPGAPQVRRVAAVADPRAANPFESVLRAIALDIPGLAVQPQLAIRLVTGTVRPDLVDPVLGIVLEADSFEWHGKRASLRADCRRYNQLVAHGWVVLRFAWEDVMHDQASVRAVLVATTRRAQERVEVLRRLAVPA